MKVLLSLLIVCSSFLTLQGQLYEPLYMVHLRASFGPTYSLGSVPFLSSMIFCQQYLPTIQNGYEVVAGIERGFGEQVGNVIKRSNFSLGASVGFSSKQFTFDALSSYPFWDSVTRDVTTLSIQSDYLVSIQSVDIAGEILYRLPQFLPKSQTKLFSSFAVILPIQSNFSQTETIRSPRNATFIDENGNPKRSVTIAEGTSITNAVLYRGSVGVMNSFFLSRNIELLQRLEFQVYSHPLNTTVKWLPTSLQASLGIRIPVPNGIEPDTPLSPGDQIK